MFGNYIKKPIRRKSDSMANTNVNRNSSKLTFVGKLEETWRNNCENSNCFRNILHDSCKLYLI